MNINSAYSTEHDEADKKNLPHHKRNADKKKAESAQEITRWVQ